MALKIVGGSFGVTGTARLTQNSSLSIQGVSDAVYAKESITGIEAKQDNQRTVSVSSLIIGFGVAVAAWYFFGWIPALVIALFACGSAFYTKKDGVLNIQFSDGKTVSLRGGPYRVDEFVKVLTGP